MLVALFVDDVWRVRRQKMPCYTREMHHNVRDLSDDQLLTELGRAAADERLSTVTLIRLLAEVEERRLYLGQGYSSLFEFCVRELHLSEHAAYGRIAAARASTRHPTLIDLLSKGDITLTTVTLLSPHLREENAEHLIDAARNKSKAETLRLIAALHREPDIASSVRRLPARASSGTTRTDVLPLPVRADAVEASAHVSVPLVSRTAIPSSEAPRLSRATTAPLSSDRYLIRVTVSREAHERLRRSQDLLRHVIPNGDPAAVIERALTVLVEQLERQKIGKARRPRAAQSSRVRSRRVPASVRREVWNRDGGRCAFVGSSGRCSQTAFLEFHHIRPFAAGGQTTVENLSLRCRAHNGHEARMFFGDGGTRSGPS